MSGQFVLRGGSCVTPAGAYPAHLPQFLPARGALAVLGCTAGRGCSDGKRAETPAKGAAGFCARCGGGTVSRSRKTLPSRWLYDDRGSELFEEITQLPEYYLTRIETRYCAPGP